MNNQPIKSFSDFAANAENVVLDLITQKDALAVENVMLKLEIERLTALVAQFARAEASPS